MKNVIFIIVLILFLGCEKEKVLPKQELLSIDVIAWSVQPEQIQLNTVIQGESINLNDNLTFELLPGTGQIIYHKEFVIERNKPVSLQLNHNDLIASSIGVYAYTKPYDKAFVIAKENQYTITLNDRVNQNVTIE